MDGKQESAQNQAPSIQPRTLQHIIRETVTPAASKDFSCWFKTRKSSILHQGQEYRIFIFSRHRHTNQHYSTRSQEKQQTILIHPASGKWIENWNLRRDSTNAQFGFTTIFFVDFHNNPSKTTNSWSWFFYPISIFQWTWLRDLSSMATQNTAQGITSIYMSTGICTAIPDANGLHELVKKCPTLTTLFKHSDEVRHTAKHYITTTGLTTHASPRRLHPEKYKIAKDEFQLMSQLGIIRPSSSPYSSPLHMVQKPKTGVWRPYDNFRTSTWKQFLKTATQSHVCMNSPSVYREPEFLQNWIWLKLTTKFQ